MKNKKVVIAVWLMIMWSFSFLVVNRVSAQECRIIRVHGLKGGTADITIEPPLLQITRGTCVIWTNWVRTDEITVSFTEGKVCDDVTEAPVGFSMTAANCYVTSWIPMGGTSSLKFVTPGTFDYVVETRGNVKAEGKIFVE